MAKTSKPPSGARLNHEQRLAWLRLIRSENVGPATFRALVNQFGGAEAAIAALPVLSRRGGRSNDIRLCSVDEAEAELAAAVGPEKPGAAAGLIVWLRYKGVDTVDRGPEPRLRLSPVVGDREGPTVSLEDIVRSLARDLNGRYWDAASSAWQ